MRLDELVKIDNRFEKSVNLLLDLYAQDKIDGYIPTRSSVKILGEYIHEVCNYSGNRATVLIGPYGKGKSHLLLVLMKILSQTCQTSVVDNLIQKIAAVNQEVADEIKDVLNTKGPFLPVILSAGNGTLNQAFMRGITSALAREELSDVVPDNYYSEAIKMIQNWKNNFPDTYKAFQQKIDGKSGNKFIKELSLYNENTLEQFRNIYPELTSGGVFNPVVDNEVISVYQSVNRILREKHGYSGIYIIFDEFSKYIEGHSKEGFAEDMKVLQDMCELCNASKAEQLHITCVAHKSIKTYGSSLPSEIINAFKGVEGRLKEVDFIVSSKNNYELLSDAITKKPAFSNWAKTSKKYKNIVEETYTMRTFSSLFTHEDYQNIVGMGCFPLTPVAAMLLLNLSEKIAQNERTIFTYITSKNESGLARYVEKSKNADFVGADSIYDYFLPLFKEETQPGIHHEWLKADYALSQTDNALEKTIIKCLAVIRMVNMPDEIISSEKFIVLACGKDKKNIHAAVERLVEEKLIEFKSRTGAFEFKNNVGIDVEQAISECIKKRFSKADICSVLSDIAKEKYILPKKHNQTFCMTRYFNFAYMTFDQFMSMKSAKYLSWRNAPDGVVILLMPGEELNEELIAKHAAEIGDQCLIVCLPNAKETCDEKAKYLLAVQSLHDNKTFIDDNLVIKKELENIAEETINELNDWIAHTYYPLGTVYGAEGKIETGPRGLNRLVSDICDKAYQHTPVINNELINRHEVQAQISKARNVILDDLLNGRDTTKYENGTSAESTIFRAVMLHPKNDKGLQLAKERIDAFFASCVDKKNSFDAILDILQKPPFGMRKGVLPFYILDSLLRLENTPTLYLNTKEVVLNVETVNNIVKNPQDYYLYIEMDTVQKNQYIHDLENLFSDYSEYCREVDKRNRLAKISCMMQSWYRSLPQTSKVFTEPDYDEQNIRELTAFRKLFTDLYMNPREILFERIPKIFKTTDYQETYKSVQKAKKDVDSHIFSMKEVAVSIIREVFGFTSESDLRQNLFSWYENLPDTAKKSVFTARTESLLNYIKTIPTGNEDDIAGKIVRETTGVFIEDWKSGSEDEFKQGLSAALTEISSKKEDSSDNQQKIMLMGEGGEAIEKFFSYSPDELSSNATFFKSAIDDIMEEYEGVLENSEILGVLIDTIKKLMI